MEALKDLARKKALNIFSSLIFVIWIIACCLLGGGFFLIEISQSKSDISCDGEFKDKDEKELIREECFDKYEKEYNKFTLYGFVFINCFILAMVTIIYSLCLQSRVGELEIPNQNVEEQPQRSRVLFTAYCCQLAATIVLAAVFIIVLQIYASTDFPSNFECDPFEQGSNSSAFSSTNGSQAKTDIYPCRNRRATKKLRGSVALTVFNGILAFFAVIELVWIFSRARNGMQFMDDRQFYADHLRSNREQEQRPQQIEEAVLPPLLDFIRLPESALRSPRDSGQVGAGSSPEQHPVIESIPLTQSERTPEQQPELQAELKRLKDCIEIRTERLEDLNQPIRPRPGEGSKPKDLELDQIFVKLVIHKHRAKYDFPTDRREQLKVFPKPKSNQSVYVPWQDIIDGNKNILLVGRPGIGKTILSTKLLRGSAFNEFTHQNFDAAFLVKFRHYNSRGEDLDLRKLLSCSETVSQDLDDEVWNYIITNPTKVLLIFDGVDEFNARSAISNDDSHFNDSEEEKMPLYYLYKKIASGKLLKGATVITTLRPTASSCVRQLRFDKVFEILGFTSKEIEDYVTRFTKEDQNPETEKKAIWQHISTNIILFALCYVPVNCFIICSCLSRLRSLGISLPTKLTKIYGVALKIFYFRHSDKYRMKEEARDQLFLKPFHKLPTECEEEFQRLGKIAFDGIKEGRLLFTSEEVEGLEDCGLLHRLPDLPTQEGLDEEKAQYCFIHLTFQEFLAAKHVVDTKKEAQELQQFITDHINEDPWQLVVQFVAGLLVDSDKAKQEQFSEMLMELLPMSTFEGHTILGLTDATTSIYWPRGKSKTALAVTLCKCLYELEVEQQLSIKEKMKKNSFNAVWLCGCNLAPADCVAILHFLKNCKEKLALYLHYNSLGDLGCMEIKKMIVESGGDCNLMGLEFAHNNMGEKGVEYLCDALKIKHCNLTVLFLENNDVGDKGAELLSDAIKDGNCKLTQLNLNRNNIGVEGVEHLRDALKDVNNLTALHLAYNNIGNNGVEYLSDALKDVNCKLTVLNLTGIDVEDKVVEHLSDALKDVNCNVSVLGLEDNSIGDKGVEHLSDALKDGNCNLTELGLGHNKVEDKGAEHLSGALRDRNCNLVKLELNYNNIGEKGVEHLRDALKDANCKLAVLHLAKNNIGEKGAEHLSDALKDINCNLTELDLTYNEVGDKGAEHLSDALKDINCNLTKLELNYNNIGEKGVEHLRDALKDAKCKLTLLHLAKNNIGEKEAEHLSDALKDVNCNLTELDLSYNEVGGKGVEHLSDALKDENCKLTKLVLEGINIGDKGAEHLSDALKDVKCTLTVLELAGDSIGDKGVEHLSDALKDVNCNLTKLSLWSNNIGDEGAKHLADALKDANCKLAVLDLNLNAISSEAVNLSDA